MLGTIGLDAGSKPTAGIALVDTFAVYQSSTLADRNGNHVPVGLDLDAFAGVFGASVTFDLPKKLPISYTASIGLPMAHVTLNTENPFASIDRFGLGDVFVSPIKIGWRVERFDMVIAYAIYVPTGRFEPAGSGGIGRGFWTHQVSIGGTIHFDKARTWTLSALVSHDTNLQKRQIDITRGDTLQAQGGFGKTFCHVVTVGIAGYWLQQVTDDVGSDLPNVLRGARDRAWGLGPEIDVVIPSIRSRLAVRYEHDFAVTSRPEGEIVTFTLGTMVWPFR